LTLENENKKLARIDALDFHAHICILLSSLLAVFLELTDLHDFFQIILDSVFLEPLAQAFSNILDLFLCILESLLIGLLLVHAVGFLLGFLGWSELDDSSLGACPPCSVQKFGSKVETELDQNRKKPMKTEPSTPVLVFLTDLRLQLCN